MDLSGKEVVVVGLGQSGVAAVRLCLAKGATVIATDTRKAEEIPGNVRSLPVELLAGGHDGVNWDAADLVVVSPGVPSFPALEDAERRGVAVIGELELAARYLTAPIVAVGGTNGKSTVTTAVAGLLKEGGRKVFAGANLGTPLSEAVGKDFDVIVAEVSSFQLERAPEFKPRVSVLLNVTDDHLDRYPSFREYADAKGNAFVNQTATDVAVIPAGDAECLRQAQRGTGKITTFGVAEGLAADFALDGGIVEAASGTRLSLAGTDFRGKHNAANAAAAVAAVRALGLGWDAVQAGLRSFRALGHRMAFVRELDRVSYYDDSKATNVGAAVTALRGLDEPRAVLLAGGRDKLGSYEPLVAALKDKGRAVVVIGEAAEAIARAVGDVVPVAHATSMDEAVVKAQGFARPGDAVLLSPACASFDMFKGYADRGDRFADAVRKLEPRGAS